MKKFFVLVCFVSIATIVSASEKKMITFPSVETIKERIYSLNLNHFADKTSIATALGGQTLEPLGAAVRFEIARDELSACLKKGNKMTELAMMRLLDQNKEAVIKLILQEHPQEFEELKNMMNSEMKDYFK